jgi:hypothetical protein
MKQYKGSTPGLFAVVLFRTQLLYRERKIKIKGRGKEKD